MARTRTYAWRVLATAASIAVTGCDPYPATSKAAPEILAVFASNNVLAVDGSSLPDGTWTISIPGNVVPGDPLANPPVPDTIGGAVEPVIFVRTNTLLEGSTIQTADQTATSDGDCTPKDNWLSATPVSGSVWYSCYYPSSPTSLEGSSIVLFASPSPISGGPGGSGWFAVATRLPTTDVGATYTLTGSVKDQNGNSLSIDVTVTVSVPATPGAITFANVASTTLTLNWTAAASSPVYIDSYRVQRTADNGGVPNDAQWTTIGAAECAPVPCAAPATPPTTLNDSGLTAATTYWYRVQAMSSGGAGHPTVPASVTTLP